MAALDELAKVEERTRRRPTGSRLIRVTLCLTAVASALGWVTFGHPRLTVVLALGAVVHVSYWYLRILVDAELRTRPRWRSWATEWVAKVTAVTAAICLMAGVVLWHLTKDVGLVLYVGAMALYICIGILVSRWRKRLKGQSSGGLYVLGTAFAIGIVSLVVATVDVSGTWLFGVGLALLAIPVGLALVADRLVGLRGTSEAYAIPWGIAAIAAGLAGLGLAGIGAYQALGLTIGVIVIVALIASDTSHDIVLVLVAITLVWSLKPQSSHALMDPKAGTATHPHPTIVALGDSYMSGEGATVYYAGTNHNGGGLDRNECRRSPTAYPVLVQQQLEANHRELLFLACSGAKAENLTSKAQFPEEPISPWKNRGQELPDEPRGGAQIPQAIDAIAALDLDPEVVLVSIGGNDAGFGDVGQACGLPGDCSLMGQLWLNQLRRKGRSDGIDRRVRAAYLDIRSTFPNARVLVVPYPVPLNESGCKGSLLRPNEHRFLVGYVRALDRVLEEQASAVGFDFLSSGVDVFTRKRVRVCDTNPSKAAVNQLAASPVSGVFLQQVSPRGWFHNAFHPTEKGHQLIADLVTEWVQHPPARPEKPSRAALSIEGIMGYGFDNCASTIRQPSTCYSNLGPWKISGVIRLLWATLVPVLLLVAGAMLVAVAAMRRWHERVARALATGLDQPTGRGSGISDGSSTSGRSPV